MIHDILKLTMQHDTEKKRDVCSKQTLMVCSRDTSPVA